MPIPSFLRHLTLLCAFMLALYATSAHAVPSIALHLSPTGSNKAISTYNEATTDKRTVGGIILQKAQRGSRTFSLSSAVVHGFSSAYYFSFTLNDAHALQMGDNFGMGAGAPSASVYLSYSYAGDGFERPTSKTWNSTGGQIIITQITDTSITLRFDSVTLTDKSSSTGSLELNGTVTASDLSTSQPVIDSVVLIPTLPTTGVQLAANVRVIGADKDALTYTYTWRRTRAGKSTIVRNNTSTLSKDTVDTNGGIAVNGDVVTVSVVAKEDKTSSASKSAEVTIANTPVNLVKVTLTPTNPKTRDVVKANVVVQDADGTVPSLIYTWIKTNGSSATILGTSTSTKTQASLDLSRVGLGNKGDIITLNVRASDGQSSVTTNTSIEVVNTAPTLANLQLAPTSPQVAGTVAANFTAADPDVSDKVDTLAYTYKWYVGSRLLSQETTNRLNLSKYAFVKAGDVVTLTMRVSDGTALSSIQTAKVTVTSPLTPPIKNSVGNS